MYMDVHNKERVKQCRIVIISSTKLREEHKLKMIDNRMMWRMFGQRRHDITAGWIKLQNNELIICIPCQILLPNIITMTKSR
jgi:hypothetical protein